MNKTKKFPREGATDAKASRRFFHLRHLVGFVGIVLAVFAGNAAELGPFNVSVNKTNHQVVNPSDFWPSNATANFNSISNLIAGFSGTGGGGSATNAITSINGTTNSAQTLQTGTAGTDFNIGSTNGAHTFNLPSASASQRGALSAADWTAFNAKQAAADYARRDTTNTFSQMQTFTLAPVISTLISNTLLYAATDGTVVSDTNLYWNPATANLGIGKQPQSSYKLDVATGAARFQSQASMKLELDAGSASPADLNFKSSDVTRWAIRREGPTGNLLFRRHDGTGLLLDTPLTFDVATGLITALDLNATTSLRLGGADVVLTNRSVATTASLTGGGNLSANRTLSLVNDNATPGNNQYYGTDGTGAKGFFSLPAGSGADNVSVNGTGKIDANFSDTTPAAPSNAINSKWQSDSATPNNISSYVPYASPLSVVSGNLTVGDGLISNAKLADSAVTDIKINASGITTRTKLPASIAYEDESNSYSAANVFNADVSFNDAFERQWTDIGSGTDFDFGVDNSFYKQITGNLAWTISNLTDNREGRIFFEYDATGGYTFTPPSLVWLNATNQSTTIPNIPTNALAKFTIEVFRRNGTNYARGPFGPDSKTLTDIANDQTPSLTYVTETLSPTGGTNFVANFLTGRTALITATNDVFFLNSTNRTSSTATERNKKIRINASGANRLLTLHSSWLLVGATTRTFTITNGTWFVLALDNAGSSETNVFAGGTYAQ